MKKNIKAFLMIFVLAMFISVSSNASQDIFEKYRQVIDNNSTQTLITRGKAIKELERIHSSDIEKDYLLGMLYYIQARELMRSFAARSGKKPTITESTSNPIVAKHIQSAEEHYNNVETKQPGYKYIYCKYTELYRDTYNIDGLKKTVNIVGKAKSNSREDDCKRMLEDTAIQYSKLGQMGEPVVQAIFEEMTKSWANYPKYILEPLGDIAQFQNNTKTNTKSFYWWSRCVDEVEIDEIRNRCINKLKYLDIKNPNKASQPTLIIPRFSRHESLTKSEKEDASLQESEKDTSIHK